MLRNWWAGVGMVTFFALAHLWDATLRTCEMGVRRGDSDVLCTCTHVRCSATDGLGAWGWWSSLHLHTCEMLRQWWGGGGWGGDDDIHALGKHRPSKLGMMTFMRLANIDPENSQSWKKTLVSRFGKNTLFVVQQGITFSFAIACVCWSQGPGDGVTC